MTAIINPKEILEKGIVYPVAGYSDIVTSGNENQVQQVGIDLRLAKAYRVAGSAILSLNKEDNVRPQLFDMQMFALGNDDYYMFEAGKQYAIDFMENVEVPPDMAAMVVHRSTINRTIGTIVSGIYDPGFKSEGGCGAIFRPNTNVQAQVGFRMAQIVFYSASAASMYDGQYQGKKTNEEAK